MASSRGMDGGPTISDVAAICGVSKKTISRVLNKSPLTNPDTRRRIERVIADMGFVPNPQARALALRRNFLIGLVHDNPNAQMVLGVQQGILQAIEYTEFALVVRPVNRGSVTMVEDVRAFIQRHRLHGVMLLPPISENDALAEVCRQAGCRFVRMGSAELDGADRVVASDDRLAVARATRHLIAAGHTRIAIVKGPAGFRSALERQMGFEDALQEAGIALPAGSMTEGDYRFESGIAAGHRLLDREPRPTAIFASNDEMAAGVIHAARMRGLSVPEDLSIVGFDDTAIASHLWPPLTTVRWPIAYMARAAALKLTGDNPASVGSIFPSTLIERGSVAGPRVIEDRRPQKIVETA